MHALSSINLLPNRNFDTAVKTNLKVYSVINDGHATPDFAMLLAETNYNQSLLGVLKKHRKSALGNSICVGIFMTDPFLNLKQFLHELSCTGVTSVCNFPSTAFYGAEFCRQLDEVGLGFQQELAVLETVQNAGFNVIISLPTAASAQTISRVSCFDPPIAWILHNGIPAPSLAIAAPVCPFIGDLEGDKFFYQHNPNNPVPPPEYSGIAQASWWQHR